MRHKTYDVERDGTLAFGGCSVRCPYQVLHRHPQHVMWIPVYGIPALLAGA